MILMPCFDCQAKPSLGNQETIGDGKYRCNKCRSAHFSKVLDDYTKRLEEENDRATQALFNFLRGGR